MLFACVLYSGNPSVHNSVTTCSGGYAFNKNSTVKSTLGLSTGLLLASIWQTIKANRSLKSSSCKCVNGSTTCSPSEKSNVIPQAPDPESSRRAALSPRLPLSLLASESDLSYPPARRETTPLPFYRMQQNDALVFAKFEAPSHSIESVILRSGADCRSKDLNFKFLHALIPVRPPRALCKNRLPPKGRHA